MTATTLPETTTNLRRLKSGLIVPATSGKRTFVTECSMFPGYFDSCFESYGTNVPSEPTPQGFSDLYEMTGNGDFRKLLGSFNLDLDLLFWKSQDQGLAWIEKHPQYFGSSDPAVFIPFIVGKKRFVAGVFRDVRELAAIVGRFEDGRVWRAASRRRFLFPQLGA